MICLCGNKVPRRRAELGYKTCLSCGDEQAKKRRHCIVPLAKSNYTVITDITLLKGLNKYVSTE